MANKTKQHGKYQQPPGTTHEPKHRRTLSGVLLPALRERRGWVVAPGPDPEGVKRPFVVDAPVLTPVAIEVAQPVPGQPSRRERRPALIKAAKEARRA